MNNRNKLPKIKCKYSRCTKGTDEDSIRLNGGKENGQKWVAACKNCIRNDIWKTIACCPEHFQAYQNDIIESRKKNEPVNTKPTISGMSDIEYQTLMDTPKEQVEEETKQELSDMGYSKEVDGLGISGTVDLINQEIDAENTSDWSVALKKNRKYKNESS